MVVREVMADAESDAVAAELAVRRADWEPYADAGSCRIVGIDTSAPAFKERDSSGRYVWAFAVLLTIGLSGCAKTEEEQIRSVISESMALLKNPSEEELSPYIEESKINLQTLDANGIDFYELLTYCFKDLDYSIDEIAIDGKDASANLTITNADLTAASKAAAAEITDSIDNYTDMLSSDDAQQELLDLYINRFYGQLSRSTATVSSQAVLQFKKNDGTWEVDEQSIINLMEGMLTSVEL